MSRAEPEPPPGDDLHALSVASTNAGFHAVCRCGGWEGWWTGPQGQLMVLDDHDHHRRAAANGGNLPPVQ